ncbi:MAG: hypothetical protein ACRD9L_22235 [Bryobacteraceae bacterium]
MNLLFSSAMWLPVTAVVLCAQDPFQVAPANYHREFDNGYVDVSRVTLRPGDMLPVHNHPAIPTVYVYLTGGGPIRFTHIQPSPYVLVRRPVRAGAIRFNRNAHTETHRVEYLGDTSSEYLRVSLKTVPGPRHRDARIAADDPTPFEDAQVRIGRFTCAPHGTCDPPGRPAVIVNLNTRTATWFDPAAGGARENRTSEAIHEIRIELKTGPALTEHP